MVLVAQTPSPCSERSPRRSQISPVRYAHMPETPHADLPQSHRQLAQWLDAVATPAKSAPAIPTAIPSAMQFAQRWLPGGALSASLRAPATSATPASEGSTRQAPSERPSPLFATTFPTCSDARATVPTPPPQQSSVARALDAAESGATSSTTPRSNPRSMHVPKMSVHCRDVSKDLSLIHI